MTPEAAACLLDNAIQEADTDRLLRVYHRLSGEQALRTLLATELQYLAEHRPERVLEAFGKAVRP